MQFICFLFFHWPFLLSFCSLQVAIDMPAGPSEVLVVADAGECAHNPPYVYLPYPPPTSLRIYGQKDSFIHVPGFLNWLLLQCILCRVFLRFLLLHAVYEHVYVYVYMHTLC